MNTMAQSHLRLRKVVRLTTSNVADLGKAPARALARRAALTITSVALATLLFGDCSSSGNGQGTTENGGGTLGTGGSHTGGSAGAAGNRAGTGGQVGTGGVTTRGTPTPVSLHIKWSTYELQGTTFTPVTCKSVGANTVGFQFWGQTMDQGVSLYSTNDSECASGDDEAFEWTHGPGDFSLYIGIWTNGSSIDQRALLGASVDFTVPQDATHVEVPEVKIIYRSSTVSWDILKAGVASTCSAAKADSVSIQLYENTASSTRTITWTANCGNNTTHLSPLDPGTYTVTATLLGSGDQKIATWTAPALLVITKDSAPQIPKITFEIP
jgi:hypothetical protein